VSPIFSDPGSTGSLPLFAYGELLQGRPLGWALPCDAPPVEAQVQGRLWRLASGSVLLSLEPGGAWVRGELHPRPQPSSLVSIPTLLTGPGLEPSFVQVRAKLGTRAQLVRAWAAPAEQLRKAGAHPLKSGDWRRIAPR